MANHWEEDNLLEDTTLFLSEPLPHTQPSSTYLLQSAGPSLTSLQSVEHSPTSLESAEHSPASLQSARPSFNLLHSTRPSPTSLQSSQPSLNSLHSAGQSPAPLQSAEPNPTSLQSTGPSLNSLHSTEPSPTFLQSVRTSLNSLQSAEPSPISLQPAGPSPTSLHSAGPGSSSLQSARPTPDLKEDPPLSRIGLNDHKAGMKGLDKDRINEIIVEASKGSKFYQNELRKDQEIKKRVDHMIHKLSRVTANQRAEALCCADREVRQLERGRDLSHVIVHVDMDAFYAAVEMRDNPSLREIPMAVGSNSMLSTSNYVARRYGIRAAMPGFIAKKLCPELVIVPLHFHKYQEVSEKIQEVLRGYDPTFCPMGLDEAYLDITSCVEQRLQQDGQVSSNNGGIAAVDGSRERATVMWSRAEQVVREIRAAILEKTRLTASAGIAPNKMLAKIASDMNKPNGQYLVPPTKEAVLSFMHSLPIRKVSGIGKVTEKMLNALGVTVCHDLYKEKDTLQLVFSPSSAHFFLSVSLGISSVQVQRSSDRKGISTERSFSEISSPDQLKEKCLELCQRLAQEMEAENIRGYTVTLKLKTTDFSVRSRAITLSQPVSKCKDLFQSAFLLLEEEMRSSQPSPLKLRLMGVRVTSLTSKRSRHQQQSLVSFLEKRQTSTSIGGKPCGMSRASNAIHTVNSDPVEEEVTFVCPVCGKKMSADNIKLNYHIDQCLNSIAVSEAVKEFTKESNI